ncbi:MAG TPA: preprotein translocase subunit SecE [Pirellulaceae bacterium]|nr:preprotein translocase subunit SecE [Pirellulaceae bacterium]HMO92486.1 preprotein translocase subunit SecE [Pirellulaceae bacterium]HMP67844.1 preprotein translocase subunit SecE [Pirellulaceae bacterium]
MNSMAKTQSTRTSFWSELFLLGLYKPTQGKITRQVTFVAIAIVAVLSALAIANYWDFLGEMFTGSKYLWGLLFSVIGLWFAFRVVNYSVFADFLIAVEAEMKKVSWPSWPELWRAALVVMFVIFVMALVLYIFDIVWYWLFGLLGVRYLG